MHDVFGFVARPFDVGLAGLQGRAHRMHAGHKSAVDTQHVENRLAHPRHDFHVDGDISAVRQLDPDMRDVGPERAHRKRHHVHGAPAHTAVEQCRGAIRLAVLQDAAHPIGSHPVVGRAGVFLVGGTDIGTVFHPRDVAGVGTGQKRIGSLERVEFAKRTGVHQLLAQKAVFPIRAVTPINAFGLGERGHFRHPGQQGRISDECRGVDIDCQFRGCVHCISSQSKNLLFEGNVREWQRRSL